ncbi:ATP-binding protein [Glutamicibacter creatinolyticus]|uniref:ATP-binding protein n=1 Tax=Glutamicibacter TaxID=1742989 RepID=UPI0037C1766B
MSIFSPQDYEKFRALRITSVATVFEGILADEANEQVDPETLFLQAVDQALEERRDKRIQKLIAQARFPIAEAAIEELDYRASREGLNPVRMSRYARNDWSRDSVNVLITGAAGSGKTHLGCAIGVAACHNEYSVRYWRMDQLALELLTVHDDHIAHRNLLNQLTEVDLLILDDFLTVGVDPRATNDLFTVLADRDRRVATMVLAQSGPEYWVQMIHDRVAADSIVNRLANNSRRINLGTVDMRRERNNIQRQTGEHWE